MMPSHTSVLKVLAVLTSMTCDTAKSPKEHMGSALRARMYAIAVFDTPRRLLGADLVGLLLRLGQRVVHCCSGRGTMLEEAAAEG